MAPRANWKGYLRLSLVSCPIALYPASSLSEKVSFNRINRKTGNRLKQQNVDSCDEDLRLADFAGQPVDDDRNPIAGIIDEQPLAGRVRLPHRRRQLRFK